MNARVKISSAQTVARLWVEEHRLLGKLQCSLTSQIERKEEHGKTTVERRMRILMDATTTSGGTDKAEVARVIGFTNGRCGSMAAMDAEEFIFRVERQAQLYGVSQDALVIGFGNLMKGLAEQWYWTFQHQHEHASWAETRQAFISRY